MLQATLCVLVGSTSSGTITPTTVAKGGKAPKHTHTRTHNRSSHFALPLLLPNDRTHAKSASRVSRRSGGTQTQTGKNKEPKKTHTHTQTMLFFFSHRSTRGKVALSETGEKHRERDVWCIICRGSLKRIGKTSLGRSLVLPAFFDETIAPNVLTTIT